MSQSVKKYNMDVGKFGNVNAYESEHGRWVKRDDYARLEQECERLRCVAQVMQDKENKAQQSRTQLAISNANLTLELDAALNQIQRLVEAGNPLSNAAYNLAQLEGRPLRKYERELMSELRERWDAALSAKP